MAKGYKYFYFSLEQMQERTETFDKMNKTFIPGTVVYNGATYNYTCMLNNDAIDRYPDARLVAEGDVSEMVYTPPQGVQKGMTI